MGFIKNKLTVLDIKGSIQINAINRLKNIAIRVNYNDIQRAIIIAEKRIDHNLVAFERNIL